jgi:EAL domain-containing protein (putative c-di-GMP-specific phosphodiesterase class I)
MFQAARVEGLFAELDFACQEAALKAALKAGLSSPFGLFVKVEADVTEDLPPVLRTLYAQVTGRLRTVVEVTEDALTAEPARVLARVQEYRRLGCLVALGHVGAGYGSFGMTAFLEPDVIKLDMSFVQRGADEAAGEAIHAVGVEAWRRGVAVVAEGLEAPENVQLARSMGATFGQGWHFSGSRGLNVIEADALLAPDAKGTAQAREVLNLGRIVSESPAARVAPKPVLEAISKQLEAEALRIGRAAVLVTLFEHGRFCTPATQRRYATVASRGIVCAVYGVSLPEEPGPGVRGIALSPGEGMSHDWVVSVISPHFAAALIAEDMADDGPDRERRFRYLLTYDRAIAVAVARSLITREP